MALLALIGTIVVVYVVITGSLSIDDNGSSSSDSTDATEISKSKGDIPKKYTVADGDTLGSIAEDYDISIKRIERLNKGLDPNTLTTGQVIILH